MSTDNTQNNVLETPLTPPTKTETSTKNSIEHSPVKVPENWKQLVVDNLKKNLIAGVKTP